MVISLISHYQFRVQDNGEFGRFYLTNRGKCAINKIEAGGASNEVQEVDYGSSWTIRSLAG